MDIWENRIAIAQEIGAHMVKLTKRVGDVAHDAFELAQSLRGKMPGVADNNRRHLISALERLRDDAETWAKSLRRDDD